MAEGCYPTFPHEVERALKVYLLVDQARKQGITPSMANGFAHWEWENLAVFAQCDEPDPQVRSLVISVLYELGGVRISEAQHIAQSYYEAYRHRDRLGESWGDLDESHRQALTNATVDLLERGVIAVPRRH